jgi:hypothetical protein
LTPKRQRFLKTDFSGQFGRKIWLLRKKIGPLVISQNSAANMSSRSTFHSVLLEFMGQYLYTATERLSYDTAF